MHEERNKKESSYAQAHKVLLHSTRILLTTTVNSLLSRIMNDVPTTAHEDKSK